ncbi:MAG: ribbon-helix-helix protein, CopG family [Acidimicrobiales bacterium]
MHKTTVYLPEELKQSLRRLAARTQRSEAELIREAIAAQVGSADHPRPQGGLFVGSDSQLAGRVEEALGGFGDR